MKKLKPLSKTILMQGIQCPKALWIQYNTPEEAPKADLSAQAQFQEGNEVGAEARKRFNGGFLINTLAHQFEESHELTQQALKTHTTIFEASFLSNGLYSRADILTRDENGDYHLIEVKKSTKVEDEHIQDSAIQTIIIESAGIELKTISLMHINKEYQFSEVGELFAIEDITERVRDIIPKTNEIIVSLKNISQLETEPEQKIGLQCDNPYECPFKVNCWKCVPDKSVFDLPNIRAKKSWELYSNGVTRIGQLDANDFDKGIKRAIEVTKTGIPYINRKEIQSEMSKWIFPLKLFDFETLGSAIPRYPKTKPYEKVPFQFSCHVMDAKDSIELGHHEYLHQDSTDPRPQLIKSMLAVLGTDGSIVAYNKTFEISVIKKLAEFDPKNADLLLALIDRFVDPWPIIKEHVYHPDFLGSFSIKYVGPALLGKAASYEGMVIGNGSAAQAIADTLLKGSFSDKDKVVIVKELLAYCRQDTQVMVDIVRWLFSQNSI